MSFHVGIFGESFSTQVAGRISGKDCLHQVFVSSPQVLVQIVELLGTMGATTFLRLPGLGGFVNDPHMLVYVGVSWKRQKLENGLDFTKDLKN